VDGDLKHEAAVGIAEIAEAHDPRQVCIYQLVKKFFYELVLECQLPHKIVDLLLTFINQIIKLTVLRGS